MKNKVTFFPIFRIAFLCVAVAAPAAHARLFEKKREKAPASYIDEACNALIYKFGLVVDTTKLQKETEWNSYRGKAVVWNMVVSDVKPKLFGGFDVYAKCQNSKSITSDVLVKYPASAKAVLGTMNQGAPITVRFVLGGYSKYFGIFGNAIFDPNDFGATAQREPSPVKTDRNKASVPLFNQTDN